MDIYRVYDNRTRLLIPQDKTSGGTTGDGSSLIMHFGYIDVNFMVGKTAWIVFDVEDADGNKYKYSKDTTPAFDGYTFSIPAEVLSGVIRNKLAYQLVFTSADTVITDPTKPAELEGQTVEESFIDYLIIQSSLLDGDVLCVKSKGQCCPTAPAQCAPGGWEDYFKANGFVRPILYDGFQTLEFQTYNGLMQEIILNFPVLTDGKIPIQYIQDIYQRYRDLVSLYNATYKYQMDARVVYKGKMYVSQTDNNVGHTPGLATTLTYWVEEDWGYGCRNSLHMNSAQALWSSDEWREDISYDKDKIAVRNGNIYVGLQADNLGHDPASFNSTEWWALVTYQDIEEIIKDFIRYNDDGDLQLREGAEILGTDVDGAVFKYTGDRVFYQDHVPLMEEGRTNDISITDYGIYQKQMEGAEGSLELILDDTVGSEYADMLKGRWYLEEESTTIVDGVEYKNWVYIHYIHDDPSTGVMIELKSGVSNVDGEIKRTWFWNGISGYPVVYIPPASTDMESPVPPASTVEIGSSTVIIQQWKQIIPEWELIFPYTVDENGTPKVNGVEVGRVMMFTQATPATMWVLPHMFGRRFVDVVATTASGERLIGEVKFIDNNTATLNFNSPYAGEAMVR